ncbi:CiaD-like domain-containing protein [Helicobacter cetorum]|uniref:CiaD-like domain-containing protein n=1 Tax=Helicobacter cetorum TaxID=138563 RepID=UPI001F320416|nr:hypothetical protein [Helicobacter cetorum]
MACKMELKNIISETLNEIEKVAKTLNEDFDVTKTAPSFFKTPRLLQNVLESTPSTISSTTPKIANKNALIEIKQETIQAQEKTPKNQVKDNLQEIPNFQEIVESTLKDTHFLYANKEQDATNKDSADTLRQTSPKSPQKEGVEKAQKPLEKRSESSTTEEQAFLMQLQERTLVLFEGMRALDKGQSLERLDLVVHFLEYQLSVVEKRLRLLRQKS